MSTEYYPATDYIGGNPGNLDNIPSVEGDSTAVLETGDIAIVSKGTVFSVHYFDSNSGAAESSPDVIAPDDVIGDGRWLLVFTSSKVANAVYN